MYLVQHICMAILKTCILEIYISTPLSSHALIKAIRESSLWAMLCFPSSLTDNIAYKPID